MALFQTILESPCISACNEARLYADHSSGSPGPTVAVSAVAQDARHGTIIVRWLVGLVLSGAAILKVVELVSEPAIALTTGRMMLPLQIGMEFGVGLFAVTGLYWRHLRWLAAILFTAFAAYSLYSAVGGATSCGCFGPLKINPWWTFGLDLAILCGLLLPSRLLIPNRRFDAANTRHLRPTLWSIKLRTSDIQLVTIFTALAVLTAAFLVQNTSGKTAAAAGVLTTRSGLTILEPEQWIGNPLPVASFIEFDLSSGDWTVLFHRHDCPACQKALPHYEQFAKAGERVALIEIPPFGNLPLEDSACHCGWLSAERDWFVQTPVEIRIQHGIVTEVKEVNY